MRIESDVLFALGCPGGAVVWAEVVWAAVVLPEVVLPEVVWAELVWAEVLWAEVSWAELVWAEVEAWPGRLDVADLDEADDAADFGSLVVGAGDPVCEPHADSVRDTAHPARTARRFARDGSRW